MDWIRFLISLGGLILPTQVQGEIERFEDGTFRALFNEEKGARMRRALMYFLGMGIKECSYKCMVHVKCVTFNYNFDESICELVGREFNVMEADYKLKGWSNFRTLPKVDGRFSEWKQWTSCQATCGETTKQLYRECNAPAPQYGGKDCEGPEVKTEKCQYIDCPVNGGWSTWGAFTPCSNIRCDETGSQNSTRNCTEPPPSHGGLQCMTSSNVRGLSEEKSKPCTVACNKHYRILVKTGDKALAGTDSKVYIKLIGDKRSTDKFQLTKSGNLFERRDMDTFDKNMKDVGKVLEMKISQDDSYSGWYLAYVQIQVDGCTAHFGANRWLEDGSEQTLPNPWYTNC